MGYILKLASKNIKRSRVRTTISVLVIAISVMSVVFARGYIMGTINSLYDAQIKYQTGHIRIINKEYEKRERLLSLTYILDDLSNTMKKIQGIKGIKYVIPRIKFGGGVSIDGKMIYMMGWGIDPKKEVKFTHIDKNIIEGRMVSPSQKEIVMGDRLLKKIGKDVGDKITIVYTTSYGSLSASTFKIVGKMKSDLKFLNDGLFLLPIDIAQKILDLSDSTTELLLITKNPKNVDKLIPKVENKLGKNQYLIQTWNKSDIIVLMKIAEKIYNFVYVFIVLLAAFIVFETMVMIVNERTKEIGMLMALGLGGSEIGWLIVLEGTILGIIGSLIGVVIGGIVTNIYSKIGMNFEKALSGVSKTFMMGSTIYPVFSIENLIFSFILGVIIIALASLIPAKKAISLNPSEALRKI